MKEELQRVLYLLNNNEYKEAFIYLNSLSLNEKNEFKLVIPNFFRVGQLERNNRRGQPFHLYFIDVYDDRDMMHFYRTLGKLYTDVDTPIEEVDERNIKRYFVPQFKEALKRYLDTYDSVYEAIVAYSKGDRTLIEKIIEDDLVKEIMSKTVENMNRKSSNDRISFVDVELLDKIKEFDRRVQRVKSDEEIDELKNKIIKNGITEPVMIDYCPYDGTIKLGEGNHRLMIAKELGLPSLPATCIRCSSTVPNYKMKLNPDNITPRENGQYGKYYYQPMNPEMLGEPFGPNYDGREM